MKNLCKIGAQNFIHKRGNMKYVLDPKQARGADDSFTLIPHSGLYIGKITQAKQVFSNLKTEGVEFTFECPKGSATSTLWTAKRDGTLTFGHSLVSALMTCLRKKTAIPVEMMVKEYDQAERKMVEKQGVVYPDLCGDIAIIFQLEEYLKRNGDIGKQANIKHFFDAESFLSSSEILDKKIEASRIHSLKDKYQDILLPLSAPSLGGAPSYAPTPQNYGTPTPQNYGATQTQNNFGANENSIDIHDDEIPF